jgi:uncharacterized membrane protein
MKDETKQARFKSVVVWSAVAAQILSILILTGVISPEMNNTIKLIISSVLEMLVLFGVLNNPTNKNGF